MQVVTECIDFHFIRIVKVQCVIPIHTISLYAQIFADRILFTCDSAHTGVTGFTPHNSAIWNAKSFSDTKSCGIFYP